MTQFWLTVKRTMSGSWGLMAERVYILWFVCVCGLVVKASGFRSGDYIRSGFESHLGDLTADSDMYISGRKSGCCLWDVLQLLE